MKGTNVNSSKIKDWNTTPTTADTNRRYAVEQAIARARNARPWRERSLPLEEDAAALHQIHLDEEAAG